MLAFPKKVRLSKPHTNGRISMMQRSFFVRSPFFLCLLIAMFYANIAPATSQTAPQRPFPQHLSYAANTIRPTNYTQAAQDQHVRDFYDTWKADYLVAAGTNSSNQPLYRITLGSSDPTATVSEGQGYGMVIVAHMAGHDPNAQTLFDGLWRFSREFPSGIDSRLMSWKIQNGAVVSGNDSAFDGDVDIAYGLLLADAQWGSSGEIDYAAEAEIVITAVLESTIGPSSRLPMLGDWVPPNGNPYNQYTPRSSDFMPAHFRAFGRATHDATWNTVIANSQAVIDTIQANNSPVTGLLPDFIINCQPISNCSPPSGQFLESSHDKNYYYNAGRDPWRIGLDGLLNGDAGAKTAVNKMITWVASNTSGNAANIKAGYQLNGTRIGNYFTTFFVAPMGVGAMLDSTKQSFLNSIYASVYNRHEGYYEDSVNLLSLLAMTGNFWDPTAPEPLTGCVQPDEVVLQTAVQTINLTWNAIAGASGYEVWWANNDYYFSPGANCSSGSCLAATAPTVSHQNINYTPANNVVYTIFAGDCAASTVNHWAVFSFQLLPGS